MHQMPILCGHVVHLLTSCHDAASLCPLIMHVWHAMSLPLVMTLLAHVMAMIQQNCLSPDPMVIRSLHVTQA